MYWEYFPKAAPRPKPRPGKARKKFGETWWGKQWVEILSEYEDDQRMSRGRAYARADRVKKFKISNGISATVQGSNGDYKVDVSFKKYKEKDWSKILQKLGETPLVMGRLLNNEMPGNISEITGYSFVPDSFDAECSCPDYANPCKHIAAVFYTLADEIDYDPMILFKLRGMEKGIIFEKLGLIDASAEEPISAIKKRIPIKKIMKRNSQKVSKKNNKGSGKVKSRMKMRGAK